MGEADKILEKLIEGYDPDSKQTPLQQFQVYVVEFLAGEGKGFRMGREIQAFRKRDDGQIATLRVTHDKDNRRHTIGISTPDPDHVYRRVADDEEWEKYVISAVYRRKVNEKVSEIRKLTAQKDEIADVNTLEPALETLTALLSPTPDITDGDKTVRIHVIGDVFRNVYERCLEDISGAFLHLKKAYAYLDVALSEGLSESVGMRVDNYFEAYGKAERRAKKLK